MRCSRTGDAAVSCAAGIDFERKDLLNQKQKRTRLKKKLLEVAGFNSTSAAMG